MEHEPRAVQEFGQRLVELHRPFEERPAVRWIVDCWRWGPHLFTLFGKAHSAASKVTLLAGVRRGVDTKQPLTAVLNVFDFAIDRFR